MEIIMMNMIKIENMSDKEIENLIGHLKVEQEQRLEKSGITQKLRYTIEFEEQNSRRFTKPWIAQVKNWKDKPELEFGNWLGKSTSSLHSDSACEIYARPETVLRWGQRDNRGNHGIDCWGIAKRDGTIQRVTKQKAREHWIELHPTTVTKIKDE